jgi:hypothetical protein
MVDQISQKASTYQP